MHVIHTSMPARRSASFCLCNMTTSCHCWLFVLILCHLYSILHRKDHSAIGSRSTHELAIGCGQVSYEISLYRCAIITVIGQVSYEISLYRCDIVTVKGQVSYEISLYSLGMCTIVILFQFAFCSVFEKKSGMQCTVHSTQHSNAVICAVN